MSIINFDNDVCALTDVGLVRDHNEDSNRMARTINGDLFVVCDGMGGHVGGATASQIGADSICQYMNSHECTIPQQSLTDALEFANSRIYATSRANPELRGMGTTACVALVRGDKVWYAHVGDSRIYYYDSKNIGLYRLTKDHSVVQAMVDQGLITEEEAETHPEKNKIRKSLGIKETVEPEPCQMPLVPAEGDMILICSDGLSGMMSEDDILEVLSTTTDINEAGKILIELANSGGGTDNITVQLMRFSNVGNREAVFSPKNKGIRRSSVTVTKRKARIRPWMLIIFFALIFFGAAILIFPQKEEPVRQDIQQQQADLKPENAYKKIVGSRKPFIYTDGSIDYAFYEDVYDDGRDVRVNLNDYSYSIGKFRASNTGSGDIRYIPDDKKKLINYRADGTKK